MSGDEVGRPEDVVSVFDQLPALVSSLDGPELAVRASNAMNRRIAGRMYESLGDSLLASPLVQGSQFAEVMRQVASTGQTSGGSEWRFALPDVDGRLKDHYFDFTVVPWRNGDGSIRGVVILANDVTDKVLTRQAVEQESARWKEQLQASRDALRALQASLLPPWLPVIPGVRIGARYVLAEADAAAGGDWFSGIPLPDGRVALVVGDVVGHGVTAAASMGQLRSVLRERLLSGAGVADSLSALDRFALLTPSADAATVCVVALDPLSGQVEYCTAGHPAPLVVEGDRWRYLPLTGAGPLGSGQGFDVRHAQLAMDGMLLLYTDGLIERPGRDWRGSTAEVGQVAANAHGGWPVRVDAPTHTAQRVCDLCVDLLTRATGYSDDITVLAAHRVPLPVPLDVTLPASPSVVFDMVSELERWLSAIDAGDDDQRDLRLALVELVTNSIEHGLRFRSDGELRLSCQLSAEGFVELAFVDNGQWQDQAGQKPMTMPGNVALGRGLGLPLVSQLAHGLTVHHDRSGTQVRLRRRVTRPAPLFGADLAPRPLQPMDEELIAAVLADDDDTLSVRGPILGDTAESLRISLDVHTRGGTHSGVVDLTAVTHLTSAGVHVLQQAQRAAQLQGADLTLVAAPLSTAHHVLTLVNIPHVTARPPKAP